MSASFSPAPWPCVAFLALAAPFLSLNPAQAADVAVPRPVPAPTPVEQPAPQSARWCYAGVSGGAQHMAFAVDLRAVPGYMNDPSFVSDHKGRQTSPLLGGQIGCNAIHRSWLVGFEFDGHILLTDPPADCVTRIDPARECLQVRDRFALAGSLRGGFIHGDLLLFGKVGLALVNTEFHFDHERTKPRNTGVTPGAPWQYEDVHERKAELSQYGVLLGFGAEYMFDEGWSAKVEFNHISTPRKEFDATITKGKFCSNVEPYTCARWNGQSVTPANYRVTNGDVLRQVANLSRGLVKVGVNKRF